MFVATEAASTPIAPERRAAALPPGLLVSLAFETQIDTDVAAAGHPLVARVTKSGIEPQSKRTLLLAGTKVNGRIVHLEHHVEGKDYFLFSVQFERLHLILDNPRQIVDTDKRTPCWGSVKQSLSWGSVKQIESKGRLSLGATFVLPSKNGRFVTPLGCESGWLTAPVPTP